MPENLLVGKPIKKRDLVLLAFGLLVRKLPNKKKMKKLLYLSALLLAAACGEQQQEDSAPDVSAELADSIEIQTNRAVSLLPEAEEEVSQWLAYATAKNEIEAMKTATGFEIMENAGPMVQIMESLQGSLPDSLKVPAVEARTNVLYTKSRILLQNSSKKTKDPKEIFGAAHDLIVEFDNFKIQLNELFLKTPQDFEVELDREFRESQNGDSLPPPPARPAPLE